MMIDDQKLYSEVRLTSPLSVEIGALLYLEFNKFDGVVYAIITHTDGSQERASMEIHEYPTDEQLY